MRIAAEIFNKYEDFIRGIIRYKVGDDYADDLFQSFFLSLVYRPPSGDVKNIKGYLYRAIMNDIVDNRRRMERYQNQMHRYAEHLNYFKAGDNPENTLIEAEEMNKMLKCIEAQLQHDEAKAVILRYRNDYKIKKIATAMGISNIAAWRYVSNGVRKIKRLLRREQL